MSQPEPQLLRSAVYFPVTDVEPVAVHYERVLGFNRDYQAGNPPEFAILSRDGQAIMLRRVASTEAIAPNEAQGGTWDVFFWVRDVKALHEELSGKGAQIVYGPIVQQAYAMEEFAVRDPAGYVLGFGQPVTSSGDSAP